MKQISQLYTEVFQGSFATSHQLIFIAEGYVASDENLFYKDVYEILGRLVSNFPFNILTGNGNNQMFSAYLSFTPSNQSGYAASQAEAQGRTVFETYFANNQLNVNYSKINEYVDELEYSNGGQLVYEVSSGVKKGGGYITDGIQTNATQCLIFIILPKANRPDVEIEVYDSDTYYTIITTADGFAEQIIARAVGKMFSLGDEFDLPGNEYLTPTQSQANTLLHYYNNLYYAPAINIGPNPSSDELFIWRSLFDQNYNYPVTIHKNLTPTVVNRNLPTASVSYKDIELFEGGGGYRTNVYRSAQDCLMRRRIGDSTLPIKNQRVSFCPVCRELLLGLFTMM